MAISSTASAGVGGWDYSGLLNGMAQVEQMRLNPYTALQTSCKNKVSAWGNISSLMTTLQTTLKKLGGEAFNTLNVSTNTAFTATATSSASADTHAVSVQQLAVAHKLRTSPFDSADTQNGSDNAGTRTVTISQGDGSVIKVTLNQDQTSLNQIAKAINTQNSEQGGNVSASIQRDGNGSYHLMLSARKTGTGGEMSVSVENDDKLATILDTHNGGSTPDAGADNGDKMIAVSMAQDAKLTVDGIAYTRTSNNINDIITGVTLNLNAVSKESDPEQLTLTVDSSAVKTNIQDFIKQYNALLTETSSKSKFVASGTDTDATDEKSGILMGDSTLRGLVNDFRSAVNGAYGGQNGGSLADLGISIDAQSGQMTLDESKLDDILADDPETVNKIFLGSGSISGLASTLSTITTKYLGDPDTKTDGLIKSITTDLDTQLKNVGTQITKTQALIDNRIELLRVQYANADALFNQMTNLSNTLTSMFSKV